MKQPFTTPEERIAAFALDLIHQGGELTERGERILRVLELCCGSADRDRSSRCPAESFCLGRATRTNMVSTAFGANNIRSTAPSSLV